MSNQNIITLYPVSNITYTSGQGTITLTEGEVDPSVIKLISTPVPNAVTTITITLYSLPALDAPDDTDIYLYEVNEDETVITLYDPTSIFADVFPTQFSGLRTFYGSSVHELCMVAASDAPIDMGGVIKILKGNTLYAVYLVDTNDDNASPIRIQTSTGTKSIRIKT